MPDTSALTTPRPVRLALTREELRALVIAVDQVVYPSQGGVRVEASVYKQLTILHERLWEEVKKR